MADRTQTMKDTAPLRLGRRNDAAEALVEQRLSDETATPERHSTTLPGSTRAALSDGGQPLDPGTRATMEGAFGESFGDVRVHANPSADAGVRAINSAAFASGTETADASTIGQKKKSKSEEG